MGRDTECDQRITSLPVTQSGPSASAACTTRRYRCRVAFRSSIAKKWEHREHGGRCSARRLGCMPATASYPEYHDGGILVTVHVNIAGVAGGLRRQSGQHCFGLCNMRHPVYSVNPGTRFCNRNWQCAILLGALLRWSADCWRLHPSCFLASVLESPLSHCASNADNGRRYRSAFGLWIVEPCKMGCVPARSCFHPRNWSPTLTLITRTATGDNTQDPPAPGSMSDIAIYQYL
jgi:hypothetical protein